MKLNKYRLGELIEQINRKNYDLKYGIDDVRGVLNTKGMMRTRANVTGRSFEKFYIIQPNEFIFNRRTTRNGERLGLAFNNTDRDYIFTEDYVAFYVKEKKLLLADYLYIFFQRDEFDRLVRYTSWGSATEFFNWEDMCDIEIILPSLVAQKKFVNIYNALLANQRVYEKGLADLKITCDAYIENLRCNSSSVAIGSFVEEVTIKNMNSLVELVKGVEASGNFIETKANMQGIDISKYKIVNVGCFAYNPSRINVGSIALCKEMCVVSPMYEVFKVKDTGKLLPQYLLMWFSRKEFQRYTLYFASGSVRDTFNFNLMQEVEIPIPDITVQRAIVDIFYAYSERKAIVEKLKRQIKDICPILIRGAMEEKYDR